MKVTVLTTSYPRTREDVAGRFVADAVEHVRRRGVEVEVVSPLVFRHYGIAYGSGIAGNLRRQGDPSHVLIEPSTPEGASSGLSGPSLVSCNNLFTVEQAGITQVIGHLSPALESQLSDCLKAALDLA